MNDTPASSNLSELSPLNAFVAALADQVFQRVMAALPAARDVPTAGDITVLVNNILNQRAPTVSLDLGVKEQIQMIVEAAIENYDPTQHMDFDSEVESLVETWIDRNLDVTDTVRECIDSGTDLEEKIREVVKGMDFTVEAS